MNQASPGLGSPHRSQALSVKDSLAYASPVVATGFTLSAVAVVQGIYAKHFGLPLTTIATIILLARIFDAVTDPLIGIAADRYYQRRGSYKPFVLAGGVLLLISSYFLYAPASEQALQIAAAGGAPVIVSAAYFLGWYLVLYLGATLFEIPHMAWGRGLAPNPQDRVRIYGWRAGVGYCGALLFYAVPLMPVIGSGEFTPQGLRWVVILGAVLLVSLLTVSLCLAPNGKCPVPKVRKQTALPLRHQLHLYGRELASNQPLRLFLLAAFCSVVPIGGMWFTLLFIYVDSYLQLGGQFSQASTLSIVVALLLVPVWAAMARRIGRREAIVLSLLFSAVGLGVTGLLNPGGSSGALLLLVMVLCYGIGLSALGMLIPPLLTDIIDYSRWKYGVDRAATYFSLHSLGAKAAGACGGALGLAIAGSFGFDPAASAHSDASIAGLRLAIAWLPAGLVLCSAWLFWWMPFDARRHSIVHRRLQARDRQATEAPPHTIKTTSRLKPDPLPAGSATL